MSRWLAVALLSPFAVCHSPAQPVHQGGPTGFPTIQASVDAAVVVGVIR